MSRAACILSSICLCLVTLNVAAPLMADDARPEFKRALFDGRTLEGWTAENGCEAEVVDGQMLLKAGDGWLRADNIYTDFKLHVEWKALKAEKYDAGIFIRSSREGKPFPQPSYQLNLLQGKEGNIGGLPGAESNGLVKAGEWNTFDITVIGETVALDINGQHAYRVGGLKRSSGYIGFQIEVPLGGQFLLRNIQLTEIGWGALFNGKDLAGWEGAGAPAEKCWTVAEREIICTGDPGPWLRSAAEYGDFNLRLEYLVAQGGNSGVYVRVPKDGNHHRENATQPPAGFEVQVLDDDAPAHKSLKDYQYSASVYDIVGAKPRNSKPAGQWNTLEINCRGEHITTSHNGVVVVNCTPEEFPLIRLRELKGYLGLQNHSTRVRFRNLRIGPALE
jgi:hypothetical protein